MRVCITGGTGSFGHAVMDKLLESGADITVFSRDEKKQHDMRQMYPQLRYVVGDVRDYQAVEAAVADSDYLFHAAALKQVPSCETNPLEAVKTNILGTNNVIRAAISQGVDKAVFLSTDKAVHPINAMGISKAMMERLVLSNTTPHIQLNCTRYGNVISSRGSVVPLFIDQILHGEDLTVTNPHMTRFMMTLEEASQLVLTAFDSEQGGGLFVQKTPACTIGDLATALKHIFKSSVGVKIIGNRPGDKMHETLLTSEEVSNAEEVGDKYYRVGPGTRFGKDAYTSDNTHRMGVDEIIDLLMTTDYVMERL